MPKPFDATLKELVTSHPADWLTQLGIPVTTEPEVLNVDLSTVTAAADTLVKVGDVVFHIDIESAPTTSSRGGCCCTILWRTTAPGCPSIPSSCCSARKPSAATCEQASSTPRGRNTAGCRSASRSCGRGSWLPKT